MHRFLVIALLALQGCKTISKDPLLIETVENMEPLRSLELPEHWTPIGNNYKWDELQFVYPSTNRLIPEFRISDCKQAFFNPKKKIFSRVVWGMPDFIRV